MYNIAVIGEKDSIYGFAALGVEIIPVNNAQEAYKGLRRVISQNYAIVYITESIASALEEEIDNYNKENTIAIIPIPGINGNTGIGMRNVKKSVNKAIGSDIIFEKD